MKCPNCGKKVEIIFNGECCEKCSPYKCCKIRDIEFVLEETLKKKEANRDI